MPKPQPRLAREAAWLVQGMMAWLFFGIFRMLPISWCSQFGAKFGRFHGANKRLIDSRIRKTLAWLMPSVYGADQTHLTHEILQNSGRCYFETMITDRLLVAGRVDAEPPEYVRGHLMEGKPLILVTVHLANLGDLIIASLADLFLRKYGYDVGGSPTRRIENPWLSSLADHIRKRYLTGINGRGYDPTLKTARDFYRFLMKPRSVVLLHLDEAYDRQVHFPSFGRSINHHGNLFKAIKLAWGTGALIQPVFLKRMSDDLNFKVEWLPALHVECDGAARSRDALIRHAQQLDELFEPRVFENLADWAQICYLRAPENRV